MKASCKVANQLVELQGLEVQCWYINIVRTQPLCTSTVLGPHVRHVHTVIRALDFEKLQVAGPSPVLQLKVQPVSDIDRQYRRLLFTGP
jgi:hypothetical protein